MLTLQEERVVFHHEIGVALVNWTTVETSMYGVICNCLDERDWRLLGRGLFSIENFRSRAAFADAVMQQRFSGKQLDKWGGLYTRMVKASTNRNKLVHQVAEELPEAAEGRRVALVPWLPKRSRFENSTPQHPTGSLHTSDIVALGREFHSLAFQLMRFNFELGGLPTPPAVPDALKEDQPTIQRIKNRIASALQLPPKPSRE